MSAVNDVLAAGRTAWPDIDVDPVAFAEFLDDRVSEHTDRPHVDLYLVHAVLARRPGALEAFCARVLPAIEGPLRQLGADAARIDELRQLVLDAAVVGGPRGPALASYAGRSDLRGWIRSVAVRIALKAWSRERPREALDDWEELADQVADPLAAHLRGVHRDDVMAAFQGALASLSPRQRTLLRLHHLDGLTLDDLARMYAVHRATAARWIAAAREAVFEETRMRLQARLGVDDTTLVSVVRLVQSQLVQSLRRLLETDQRAP